MATWAIGDIQGCGDTFEALLERIDFQPGRDQLWLAGDLVNRGPASLRVLRRVMELGDHARVVLGNHDLHLLSVAAHVRALRRGDTLDEVLDAPDLKEILSWLRTRPILIRERGFTMVHAGIHPRWSLDLAEELAQKAERRLAGEEWKKFLMTINERRRQTRLPKDKPVDFVRNALFLRCVEEDGVPLSGFSGPPEEAPKGARPWYLGRDDEDIILFGHWAAHGFRRGAGWVALDSGCVWGGQLSAWCLEDGRLVQEPSRES